MFVMINVLFVINVFHIIVNLEWMDQNKFVYTGKYVYVLSFWKTWEVDLKFWLHIIFAYTQVSFSFWRVSLVNIAQNTVFWISLFWLKFVKYSVCQ